MLIFQKHFYDSIYLGYFFSGKGGGDVLEWDVHYSFKSILLCTNLFWKKSTCTSAIYLFFFLISNKSCLYNGLVLKQSIINFFFVFSYEFYTCMLLFWCQNSINEEKKKSFSCIVNIQNALEYRYMNIWKRLPLSMIQW